jgi:hypothetical protein
LRPFLLLRSFRLLRFFLLCTDNVEIKLLVLDVEGCLGGILIGGGGGGAGAGISNIKSFLKSLLSYKKIGIHCA